MNQLTPYLLRVVVDEKCGPYLNSEKGAELHVNMYRATKVSHETLHMM